MCESLQTNDIRQEWRSLIHFGAYLVRVVAVKVQAVLGPAAIMPRGGGRGGGATATRGGAAAASPRTPSGAPAGRAGVRLVLCVGVRVVKPVPARTSPLGQHACII
eukprot:3198589-Pyramimonas_sp.AAC.1